ncbi:MAG TPA: pyridoxal-dependent decarboxylase, partial [Azospirillaceae bacterium]|nr:pyridoxal-dependent decarboxylase [Azospirillaceae bacterium]
MPNGFMSMRDPPTERAALSSAAPYGDGALEDLFDAEVFARQAALAVERLADHLADDSTRGLALTDPALLLAAAADLTRGGQPEDGAGHDQKLAEIIDLYARSGIQVYSPGYMGRQFSGPFPVMAVMDMVSAIATQPASFYEAGPLPSVAERIMGEELNRFLGFPADSFAMVTTSGGSLANMTALLAARNRRYPAAWRNGAHHQTGLRPAIAASEEVHYSITRAAGIIGVGEDQVVRLPL